MSSCCVNTMVSLADSLWQKACWEFSQEVNVYKHLTMVTESDTMLSIACRVYFFSSCECVQSTWMFNVDSSKRCETLLCTTCAWFISPYVRLWGYNVCLSTCWSNSEHWICRNFPIYQICVLLSYEETKMLLLHWFNQCYTRYACLTNLMSRDFS